ncbi:hypothetical protein EOM86_13215, partial [Candidatus Nomurabacteria bacterium]|nr:hypothetical protein [Candidatus Nomurabacteria bacterium]
HRDTKRDHIHLIVNRISVSGKVFDAFRDQVKSKDICRQLEQEHNLTVVSNAKARNTPRTTQKERQQIQRTGIQTEKIFVQEAIKASLGDEKLTARTFIEQLEEQGITAIPNVATTGKMNGFSFRGKEMTYTGSQVGYSWKYLQPHLEQLTEGDIAYLCEVKDRARVTVSDKTDSPKPAPVRSEARREIPTRREETPENPEGDRPEHRVFPGDTRRSIQNDDRPTGDDRSDETSHQAEHLEKLDDSLLVVDSNELGSWNDLASDISEVVEMDSGKKTAAVQAKERAWERQNSILNDENGFSRYRLTLVPRGDGDRSAWIPGQRGDTEQFFTAEEVKEKITMLSRKNFEGYDIYVTPINQRYVYIMIDDLKAESIEQMKADGFQPNAVWETSKDNHQAIFRIERSTP